MMNDDLHVVHARAAGLDVHKLEIAATVRLCAAPTCETRRFSALASGLKTLVAWLTGHRVEAAAVEATGVLRQGPWRALDAAGIDVQLLNAQHVKQLRGRKTDVEDSRRPARVCRFGLGRPGFVPSAAFRDLRSLSRHRRALVSRRSRIRNQAQKILDRSGVRIGGVLSDVFGMNGRRILDGLLARRDPADILASLSGHVRHALEQHRRCAGPDAERHRPAPGAGCPGTRVIVVGDRESDIHNLLKHQAEHASEAGLVVRAGGGR